MRKIVVWLMMACCLLGAVAQAEEEMYPWPRMGVSFYVEDGVVYWLDSTHAWVVGFDPTAEDVIVHERIGSRQVSMESMYDWTTRVEPTGARTLTIEQGVEMPYELSIDGWVALERLALPSYLPGYQSIRVRNCPVLTEVKLPTFVRESMGLSYENCPLIRECIVPEGSTNASFDLLGCQGIERVVLPKTLKSCWPGMFQDLPNLKSVELDPENPYLFFEDGVLYSRENMMLFYMTPLYTKTHYAVKEGTRAMDCRAFSGADQLESLSLPATVEWISNLEVLKGLKSLTVDEKNPWFEVEGDALYRKTDQSLALLMDTVGETFALRPSARIVEYFYPNDTIKRLVLPEGFTTMNSYFLGGTQLREIVIPASVDGMGQFLQPYSGSLERYEVAAENEHYRDVDGVLFSKDGQTLLAFPASHSVAYAIPEGTETLDWSAFAYNKKLERLEIPASLTEIPDGTLNKSEALREIVVDPENPKYASKDGVLFSKDLTELVAFPPSHGTYYDVPRGTQTIGVRAFADNMLLESVTLAQGVTEISDRGFERCEALRRISLPLTLQRIGDHAFSACVLLSDMRLPDGMQSIGLDAFNGCLSMQTLWVPKTVTTIGQDAFGWTNDDLTIIGEPGSAAEEATRMRQMPFVPIADALHGGSAEDALLQSGEGPGGHIALKADNGDKIEATHGDAVQLLRTAGDVVRVWYKGMEATVPMENIYRTSTARPFEDFTEGIVRKDISLRAFPATDGTETKSIRNGAMVTIDARAATWLFVTTEDGDSGYLPLDAVLPLQKRSFHPDLVVTTILQEDPCEGSALYALPSEESAILSTLPAGEQLLIRKATQTWCRVETADGTCGYILMDNLLLTERGYEING